MAVRAKVARGKARRKRAPGSRLTEAEIDELFRRLQQLDPHPKTELKYRDPFTLLVAVILSAQATDASVNRATPDLFRTADTFTRQKSDSIGIFANATWHITPALDLTGGLRYSHDKKDYTQRRFAEYLPNGALGAFRTAPGTNSTTVQDDATFEQVDYRATLDYDITPDVMVYATVSKAYKAGTYSYTIQSWTAANNATGPKMTTAEKATRTVTAMSTQPPVRASHSRSASLVK